MTDLGTKSRVTAACRCPSGRILTPVHSFSSRCGIIAALLSLAALGCGREASSYDFRYANSQPPSHPRSKSMVFFEEELEKRTSGRIQVETYLSGVLGIERDVMDMVATGVLQGTRGGLYVDANIKYSIFELPFLVENWDQALRLVYSDFTVRINREARRNGYHVPACGISQGFRAHTNNLRPLRTLADFKGLKLRVPPQEMYVVTTQAFGANPHEIPFVEVYQAAQTGVIDGTDNAASNLWEMQVHEVQKYLTVSNYSIGPDPMMVNLDWYEGLPEDLQSVFDEVSVETIRYSDRMNRESEGEYIRLLSESLETNYVTGDNLAEFKKAVEPVYAHFVEKGYFTWDDIEEARRAARGSE